MNVKQIITTAATAAGFNPDLLLAIAITESGLNPNARGKDGEIGLFQILERTWKPYAEKLHIPFSALAEPKQNTAAALMILHDKMRHYKHPARALIGYNGHGGRFTIGGVAYLNRVLKNYTRITGKPMPRFVPTESRAVIGGILAATAAIALIAAANKRQNDTGRAITT